MKGLILAATAACFGLISSPANSQCAPAPPSTGLGPCLDFMVASSDLLTGQVHQLQLDGWAFAWGTGSNTDYQAMVITIQSMPACGVATAAEMYFRTAVTAHEMGHALRGYQQDTSSREAYIDSWCSNEGHAVINNIQGREEVLVCSVNTVDIGIAASNPSQLLSLYVGGGDIAKAVGGAFCDHNVTSTNPPMNYRDFYGDWYDTHY